jgi:hypothetical protein
MMTLDLDAFEVATRNLRNWSCLDVSDLFRSRNCRPISKVSIYTVCGTTVNRSSVNEEVLKVEPDSVEEVRNVGCLRSNREIDRLRHARPRESRALGVSPNVSLVGRIEVHPGIVQRAIHCYRKVR